jgi:phosphopantothenoylcysteine decarboxylase/phosphopantothenate--cysteine ligase
MWNNPIVQRNLADLRALGRYHVVPPEAGELACGVEGEGRLAPLEHILSMVRRLLRVQDLADAPVLVTAGPTREPLDPVRFLTNRSTGRMGYALAAAAWERGAQVTLVSGPTDLAPPFGVDLVRVETAAQMSEAVFERLPAARLLAMVAAVADYRPAEVSACKMKKSPGPRSLLLERTTDILAAVGDREHRPLTLGFAAETENVEANAREKLVRKRLDFVFGNAVGEAEGGFRDVRNAGVLVDRWGGRCDFPLDDKRALAHGILDRVNAVLSTGGVVVGEGSGA